MELVQLGRRFKELSCKRSQSAVVCKRVIIKLENVYILLTVRREREGMRYIHMADRVAT